MLTTVRGNRELLEGIARDSREQAASIEEISTAVREMDETEHSAALVEEANASAKSDEWAEFLGKTRQILSSFTPF